MELVLTSSEKQYKKLEMGLPKTEPVLTPSFQKKSINIRKSVSPKWSQPYHIVLIWHIKKQKDKHKQKLTKKTITFRFHDVTL